MTAPILTRTSSYYCRKLRRLCQIRVAQFSEVHGGLAFARLTGGNTRAPG